MRQLTQHLQSTMIGLLTCALIACGGGGGGSASSNAAPTAVAGNNQTIVVGDLVYLNGLASSDPEGSALTYVWTLTKPAGSAAALSSATAAQPTFIADVVGSYTVGLTVNDGTQASTAATAVVTAVANTAPVANAGAAQTKIQGDVVVLSGGGSTDANQDALTYSWVLTSKPAASVAVLSAANTVSTGFTADKAGGYVATLTVTDSHSASHSHAVTITVQANIAPIANAGSAQAAYTGALVSLSGAASTDGNHHQPHNSRSDLYPRCCGQLHCAVDCH